MEWRTRVLALVALIGMGEGYVKAVKYSSGFYFDNGELAGIEQMWPIICRIHTYLYVQLEIHPKSIVTFQAWARRSSISWI